MQPVIAIEGVFEHTKSPSVLMYMIYGLLQPTHNLKTHAQVTVLSAHALSWLTR